MACAFDLDPVVTLFRPFPPDKKLDSAYRHVFDLQLIWKRYALAASDFDTRWMGNSCEHRNEPIICSSRRSAFASVYGNEAVSIR